MTEIREYPGGQVVRILGFHCHGPGSIPGWGTEILQAVQHSIPPPKKMEIRLGNFFNHKYKFIS